MKTELQVLQVERAEENDISKGKQKIQRRPVQDTSDPQKSWDSFGNNKKQINLMQL